MNISNLIAAHILEVYERHNWTDVNISNVIKGTSWQQAQQKTAGSPNTIASLLHHLYYWNGIVLQRLYGKNPFVPDANGFDVGELNNESDWNALKEKTRRSFIELSEAVNSFPEEKLTETYAEGRSSYYKNFQGIVEHAHYHLGQMVIIKKLL